MSFQDRRRIHQVCASIVSDPEGTDDFDRADAAACRLAAYAKKLGFQITHDNVDGIEE